MAFAGLVWFAYLLFHLFSLLIFHSGNIAFDDFYSWLNQLPVYQLMIWLLIATLIFHAVTAFMRQLANNISKGQPYHKAYPHGVPRIIAWGGASTLLLFIVFHFVQMKLWIDDSLSLYQQLTTLLSQPLMLAIYALGMITLSAHLHHALSNVLQTLGISSKPYHLLVILIVAGLFIGFASIPVSVIL